MLGSVLLGSFAWVLGVIMLDSDFLGGVCLHLRGQNAWIRLARLLVSQESECLAPICWGRLLGVGESECLALFCRDPSIGL